MLLNTPHTRDHYLALVLALALAYYCCCLIAPPIVLVAGQAPPEPAAGEEFYAGPGVLASEIIRARGYIAQDHYLRSLDGYTIRLTRGLNPKINGGRAGLPHRVPILFVHGILESYNVWVINSFGARPQDLSNVSLADLDEEAAEARLAGEPSANSLALLAMDSGHEVWIMSRRGFPGSQMMSGNPVEGSSGSAGAATGGGPGPLSSLLGGLTDYGQLAQQIPFSFNRRFWNFSLDEQARFDFPQAVDLVRRVADQPQISVVCHSAGGAIALMALSLYPELNEKLSSAILWSQGFSLGHGDIFNLLPPALPLLHAYVGSVPPAFTTDQIQALAGLFCITQLAQWTLCEGVADLILGWSGGQQPMRPEYINSLLYSSSSHEIAQDVQTVLLGGQLHRYDWGPAGNWRAYGQLTPPAYELARVSLPRMSFYVGLTDRIVSPADVRATLPLLRVPHQFHLIDAAFNHNGYFYHKQTARLAVVPSLREIQLFARESRRRNSSARAS